MIQRARAQVRPKGWSCRAFSPVSRQAKVHTPRLCKFQVASYASCLVFRRQGASVARVEAMVSIASACFLMVASNFGSPTFQVYRVSIHSIREHGSITPLP